MGEQKILKMLNNKKIQYDYDNFSDVLYVSFGKPKPAISVQSEEGYLARYEPSSDKLVGITIVDFREKFFKNKRLNIKGFISHKLPDIISALH